MTRKQFKQCLVEAIEFHDGCILNREVEKLLYLNYDEDSSIVDWTFANFNTFALDYVTEGISYACRYSDLKWEDEDDEDDDDEPTIEYYKETDDPIVTEEVYEYYYSKEGED